MQQWVAPSALIILPMANQHLFVFEPWNETFKESWQVLQAERAGAICVCVLELCESAVLQGKVDISVMSLIEPRLNTIA